MGKTVKVGVIGMGQMGLLHARIYHEMPTVDLHAICETDRQRRDSCQKEFGCRAYSDYQSLLEDPELDAVSIVLPDNIHREAVELAIKNRKHILLEKPLAKELEDGKAIYELAKDYDKVFTVGFLLRFDPRFSLIKAALDRGDLGEIIHLYCRRNSPIIGPRRYIGASNLSMHVMIHDIDYINWYMNCRPVKVFAKARRVRLKENEMDDTIFALVTYENGAIACLEACWVLPENSPTIIDDQLELVGTKGIVYVDACDKGLRLVLDREISYPDSRHWYYVNGVPGGDLAVELQAFIGNITKGSQSIVTVKEAYESLRVVDAIERSLSEGVEVTL